jgi:hypothetical protein
VSHKICEPYWRVAKKCPNSLSMNPHYETLVSCLETWAADATSLVDGSATVFGVDGERISDVSNSLYTTSSDEHNALVANVLQRLCSKAIYCLHVTLEAETIRNRWK